MATEARPVDVCYIEDNPGDVRLMTEVLAEAKPCCRLHVFPSLEPTIKALIEENIVHPDLILVDAGLFNEDSSELLRLIRVAPNLAKTPVVIFSGSRQPPDDREQLWDRWVQKPMDLDVYSAAVRDILTLLPSA